jgi:hypothetical protein
VKTSKMLQKFGEMNTAEVYSRLNESKGDFSMRHGVSMQTLGNVLSKERVFVKMVDAHDDDAPRCMSLGQNHAYKIASWDLDRGFLELHPEVASETTNSYRLRSVKSVL